MRGEPVELSCPYCDKGRIQCWFIPGVMQEKRRRTQTFGVKHERHKSSDTWLVQSGCNVCGKSSDEIERELRKRDII